MPAGGIRRQSLLRGNFTISPPTSVVLPLSSKESLPVSLEFQAIRSDERTRPKLRVQNELALIFSQRRHEMRCVDSNSASPEAFPDDRLRYLASDMFRVELRAV